MIRRENFAIIGIARSNRGQHTQFDHDPHIAITRCHLFRLIFAARSGFITRLFDGRLYNFLVSGLISNYRYTRFRRHFSSLETFGHRLIHRFTGNSNFTSRGIAIGNLD